MKKFALTLLLSLILGLLLVACGGGEAEDAEEPAPTEAVEEEVVEEEEAMDEEEESMDEEESMEEEEAMDEEEEMEEESMEEEEAMDEEEEMEEEEMEEEEMEEEVSTAPEGCNEDLAGEEIVIYQQAGLEGPLAAILGTAFSSATADALEIINAEGGVCGAELVVEFRETNYNVELEVAAYEEVRVADPEPIILFTYASGATIALKDRVVEDQIVNLAAGLNAEATYNPANGYTVLPLPIYSDQFAGFLTFLADNWDDVKPDNAGDDIVVGVIGWANSYGAGATTPEALAVAEELGITVLPLEEQEISPEADVSGAVQNMLVNGANVIYNQNLSFSVAQVIGTVRALGVWQTDVIVGGVSWSFNADVLGFLGENAVLADGYYGVVPQNTFSDTDLPGVQLATETFNAAGNSEADRNNTYLLTFGSMFAVRDIFVHAVNEYGYENLSGETFLMAMQDLGRIDALGLFELNVEGPNRAPTQATIRQWQLQDDGTMVDVVVQDWFDLPDTRPSGE